MLTKANHQSELETLTVPPKDLPLILRNNRKGEPTPVNCSLTSTYTHTYTHMYTFMHTQAYKYKKTQKPQEQLRILYTDMSSTAAQPSKVDRLKKSKSNNSI